MPILRPVVLMIVLYVKPQIKLALAQSVNRLFFMLDIVSGNLRIMHGKHSLLSYVAKWYSDFMAERVISREHFRPLCEEMAILHLVTAEMICSLKKSQPRLANLSTAQNCFLPNLQEVRRVYTIFELNFPEALTQSQSASGTTTHLGLDITSKF